MVFASALTIQNRWYIVKRFCAGMLDSFEYLSALAKKLLGIYCDLDFISAVLLGKMGESREDPSVADSCVEAETVIGKPPILLSRYAPLMLQKI